MEPESHPSSEQGLASAVNLAGASDHEFTQTDPAKHASFSGSLVAEVSSALHLKRLLITLDFPQPNRETARCEQSPKSSSESTSSRSACFLPAIFRVGCFGAFLQRN